MITLRQEDLEIRHYSMIPEWDQFVHDHPCGSIYHTTKMIQCEERTKLHSPYAYGAVDGQGNVCALLVSVCISQFATLPKQLCSRSIMYAEPICLENTSGHEAVRALIRMHDDYMSARTLFSEVRPSYERAAGLPLPDCGYDKLGYLNYELCLDGSEVELFTQVGQKVRNNVRSANRNGVVVDELDLRQTKDVVYGLLLSSYAKSKTPIVDISHFEAASRIFNADQLKVLVAHKDGEAIATGCFLRFKDRVTCWYAGTKRIPGIAAMSLVFWEAIRLYAARKCRIFDFAGAGWQGESYGPGNFKRKFGGQQTNHGRYRKVYAPWTMLAAQSVFRNVKQFIAPRVAE